MGLSSVTRLGVDICDKPRLAIGFGPAFRKPSMMAEHDEIRRERSRAGSAIVRAPKATKGRCGIELARWTHSSSRAMHLMPNWSIPAFAFC